ncbi:MAG: hypothetical protein MJB57_09145 [Gemmatimonadetes bacterium]|nr:hypothetical protein [Gemmatimonadota bacterium]
MTGDETSRGSAGDGPPDQPRVERIARLVIEPSPGFGRALGRRINRRVLGNDLVDLSFSAWIHAIIEYVLAAFGLARKDGKQEEGE